MTPTLEEVQQALIALGSTPQEVRDSLIAAGCKGDRGSCYTCPVAVYLKHRYQAKAFVGCSNWYVWDNSFFLKGKLLYPITGCVKLFDTGDPDFKVLAL